MYVTVSLGDERKKSSSMKYKTKILSDIRTKHLTPEFLQSIAKGDCV